MITYPVDGLLLVVAVGLGLEVSLCVCVCFCRSALWEIICMCGHVMVMEIIQVVKVHPVTMAASKFIAVVVVVHNLQ